MTHPNSHLAYMAELDAFDRARDDPTGIRIFAGTRSKATTMRHRLHYARRILRNRNKEIYSPGDPLYGASVYDDITCTLREDTAGEWWVYLERSPFAIDKIESLSQGDFP